MLFSQGMLQLQASFLPLFWATGAGSAMEVPEGQLKPTTVFSQLPQRSLVKRSLTDTAFSLCMPAGEAWVWNRLTKRPVLQPMVYWYSSVRYPDLGLFLTPLYLYKMEVIRDKAGPWRGKMGLDQAYRRCGNMLLFWKDSSCGWARQGVIVMCGQGVGLPSTS